MERHLCTGVCKWPVHKVDLVKKYHKDFFTAGLQHQEELKKDDKCSLPISAVPFGLLTAPRTFLEPSGIPRMAILVYTCIYQYIQVYEVLQVYTKNIW